MMGENGTPGQRGTPPTLSVETGRPTCLFTILHNPFMALSHWSYIITFDSGSVDNMEGTIYTEHQFT
jgi:hypothetical protein